MNASVSCPHLDDLPIAELDPVPDIKSMDDKEEEHRLVKVLDAVPEDEDKGERYRRDGHPKIGDVDL